MIREEDTLAWRRGPLRVGPLETAHVETCARLWRDVARDRTPAVWEREPERVTAFIRERAESGLGVYENEQPVGYAVFDVFDFHGRRAAFCPVMAHAVLPRHRLWGYRLLYGALSGLWVGSGRLDHYISFFASDRLLLDLFFDLGFGRYVVDAYRSTRVPVGAGGACRVVRAGEESADALRQLCRDAAEFYRRPPLFLIRQAESEQELLELLSREDCAVFLALVDERPVGFMNACMGREPDPISLADTLTGLLDPLGAFVLPEYRGRGIGDALLEACRCRLFEQGAESIHVDFEGANPFASGFWLKHFAPLVLSLKRSVHVDVVF